MNEPAAEQGDAELKSFDVLERDRLKLLSSLRLLQPDADNELGRILRCPAAALHSPWLTIIVQGDEDLRCVSSINWPPVPATAVSVYQKISSGSGLTEHHFDDGQFAEVEPLFGSPNGRRFFAAMTLDVVGQPVGLLCIADTWRARLSAEELSLLQDFRELIERELEMRIDSTRDHLTGLLNRRFLEDFFDRETRRAFRDHAPIGIALLDVDHFKAYNDLYGHAAGDEALRQLAIILANICRRPADLAVRLGGEEFLMVLPASDLLGTERMLQRLQRAIVDLRLIHEGSPYGTLTISAGAVVLDGARQNTLAEVIEIADTHLYAAKRAGRNRYLL